MNKEKQIEEMAEVLYESDNKRNVVICGIETVAEDLYNAGYRKASEVAREIFEEIERLMLDGAIGGKYPIKVINPDKYAELKKKYTEREKDE